MENIRQRTASSEPHDLSVRRVVTAPAAKPATTASPTRVHHRFMEGGYPEPVVQPQR